MKLFHKKGENDEVDQLARRNKNLTFTGNRNSDYEDQLRKDLKKLLYDDDDDDDEHMNDEDAYDQIKND